MHRESDIAKTKAYESLRAFWTEAGLDMPPAPPLAQKPAARTKKTNPPAQQSAQPESRPLTDLVKQAQAAAAKANTLDELRGALESFDAGPVKQAARHTVFARGNAAAKVMIMGEAPGREEDRQGQPFVGQSGQLLDRMLATIGLDEHHFYISNVFNWRPPGNRKPAPDELALCLPFTERHIALVKPAILVLTGACAAQTLLRTKRGITGLRGRWVEYSLKNPDGSDSETVIPALPLFHPAFLLRTPMAKRDTWHDLLNLEDKLNALSIAPQEAS